MSRSNRAPRRTPRPQRILIFGESENDTKVIAELIQALCPQAEGKVQVMRNPPVMIKNARPGEIPNRTARIRAAINAERVDADLLCVFIHEDCDDVVPAHLALSEKIEAAYAGIGVAVHAASPAWEMEAWLLQWPNAVAAYRSSWKALPSTARDTGHLRDAKENLRRALRPDSGRGHVRDYQESDAPGIAAKVRELGLAEHPVGHNASYDRFRDCVSKCCPRHGG